MKIIPNKVKRVSRLETKSLLARAVKLMEEAGELAAEVLKYEGLKGRNGKSKKEILDALHLEGVDVMLMAQDILIRTGATDKKICKIIDSQLKKWYDGSTKK
jgi:NTP pyrophosphatase (non-canonical NTP hydrolase)